MKKQVVAVMLSLAMCASTGAEASIVSAAEFSSEVSVAEDTGSDEASVAETNDGSAEVDDSAVAGEADDVTEDISQTEDAADEDNSDSEDQAEVDFSSGDEEAAAEAAQNETPVVTEDAADQAGVKESASAKEAVLYYNKWENVNGKWKLKKLVSAQTQEAQQDTAVTVGTEDTAEAGTDETVSGDAAEENTEAAENTEGTDEAQASDESAAEAETLQADDEAQPVADEQQAAEAGASAYYTAADGLVKITSLDLGGNQLLSGYYAFDKDGYLLTGRSAVGNDYYYFRTESEVKISNHLSANMKTPYNSQLGQAISGTWMWNAGQGVFNYYGNNNGKQENLEANKIYSINGASYYLLSGGKPYVGDQKISGHICYFQPAASANSIPGRMAVNGWASKSTNRGPQWRYFDANGYYQKKGIGAYKLLSNSANLYLLDANGYLIRTKKPVKGADGYYYMADGNGIVYRDKLIKYGKYRYYFTSNGRRATWKNRWVKLAGAGNRYYYFGKVAGRVQEQKGIKKVTVNGKFVGWFYFSAAGNSYLNAWKSGRYYLADGRMASGVTKINGKYYFFQRSSSKAYKGKVYKAKWIKYNGKYYYASGSGVLAENGWKRIKSDGRFYYFYFQNLTAVTNKSGVVCNGNHGSLDSRGRFVSAGWVVVNNKRNYVRYMDPKTGKYVKNTVKWIDGVQYRFDSRGYRVNDRTKEFKRSSYYLTCDRVNGVMTVYTDSSMKIPIKSIRVSVGKAETPTRLGTFTLTRSARWQPLMGPSWGQYGTHVTGGIFVHSVACGLKNDHNLPAGEYYKLGNPASHGCIRCCVADAKWVYDNCNGSRIYVFNGKYTNDEAFKGPLGRRAITPLRGNKTFDPTDPAYAGK